MNKYEIIDMIDEGAYGIVWKATNKQTGDLVAIKEFKDGDDDQISRKNIQREIRMLKMLKGEYIVNIKQAFKKKNKVFLIFEYFPKNLLNIIEIFSVGLEPALIQKIAYKVIKCLRFLHQKNIIHRDIKPENILLQKDAQVIKLCDFGFARFIPQYHQNLTQYVATRWYRSPQLLVGQRYGKPADIWALGCIIGELVDGQPIFPGQNQMDQLYLIRKACGQLPEGQIKTMSSNPKFQNLQFPSLKRIEPLQARYIGKIQRKALSFMKACLTLDPANRITVEQALTHPFLIQLSVQENEHVTQQQTNLLYTNRHLTKKNQGFKSIEQQTPNFHKQQKVPIAEFASQQQPRMIQASPDQIQQRRTKSKFYDSTNNNNSINNNEIRLAKGGSLPENAIYKILHQATGVKKQTVYKMTKKFSQANLKYGHQQSQTKLKHFAQNSPKMKVKKQSVSKLGKVMSEQKKLNYKIDVKLNINVKINQKLKNIGYNSNNATPTPILSNDSKLPQIKNNSKILKYRLHTKYPGSNINTIYNSYGNLSILGESKQLSKGFKKLVS